MSGIEVFLVVIGAWFLISTAVAAGLSLFQWICLPIAAFIDKVKMYNEKRLGERGA